MSLVLVDDPEKDEATNKTYHQNAIIGWQQWAPNLVALKGPGNHMAVLKSPHVNTLVQQLNSA